MLVLFSPPPSFFLSIFLVAIYTTPLHQHVAVLRHCDLIARITCLKCMLIGKGIIFSLVSWCIRHISIISAPRYTRLWVSSDNGFEKSKFACKKNKDKVTLPLKTLCLWYIVWLLICNWMLVCKCKQWMSCLMQNDNGIDLIISHFPWFWAEVSVCLICLRVEWQGSAPTGQKSWI